MGSIGAEPATYLTEMPLACLDFALFRRRSHLLWCCLVIDAVVRFKRLLRGRRLLTGRLGRYWGLRGRRRSFMGSASRGLLSCSGSRGSVRDRREGVHFC